MARRKGLLFNGLLGEVLTSNLVTSPIRRMIDRDAEQAGIDTHNPCRSVARFLGSCGMATALGAFLEPPGGILGGFLGYVVATILRALLDYHPYQIWWCASSLTGRIDCHMIYSKVCI